MVTHGNPNMTAEQAAQEAQRLSNLLSKYAKIMLQMANK